MKLLEINTPPDNHSPEQSIANILSDGLTAMGVYDHFDDLVIHRIQQDIKRKREKAKIREIESLLDWAHDLQIAHEFVQKHGGTEEPRNFVVEVVHYLVDAKIDINPFFSPKELRAFKVHRIERDERDEQDELGG